MNFLKYVFGVAVVVSVTACGGGGGSAGTTSNSGVSGSSGISNAGDTQTTEAGSVTVDLLNGAGLSTQSISAIEIAQVRVVVKDAKGALVPGTIASFSETGVGLLKFSPSSQTAMTTSQGLAVMEVRAADQTKTGATTVSVSAIVGGKTITAVKNLEITNAPLTGGVVIDPQTLASSINFVSTDPADKSIVLAGAGGNGRTETGVLKFRVVDKNNTPVKGVLIDFVVNPSADVTLNIASSTTDADGVVITSVSSKSVPTAVVVKATVNGRRITTQSDQLKVTTGLGTQAGFEILPLVYNLDGALSGDSTIVTARLVDGNGNRVADGVPVVFVTTGGGIASSSAGGCNTFDGACTVPFTVQEPRPADGIVTITGSAKVGESTTLLRQIKLNMSTAPIGIYEPESGVPATVLTSPAQVSLNTCSKVSRTYMVANSRGYSAPSGTTISVVGDTTTGLGAGIGADNTVLDVGNFGPSAFNVTLDPTSANNPACNSSGIGTVAASIEITANAPKSKRVSKQTIALTYPAGNLQLFNVPTTGDAAAITALDCDTFDTEISAIGSDGLTLPSGATFVVSASDGGIATISNVSNGVFSPNTALLAASNSANAQSLWLRVTAPAGGAAVCQANSGVAATFTVNVTVVVNGRSNTKKIVVTYPKAK